MVRKIFAERMKELRIEKGMTQSELGQSIGLPARRISRLELLSAEPSTEIIVAVAKFFNVTTDYLLGLANV